MTRKFSLRTALGIMNGRIRGYIITRDGRPVRILAWDAMGDFPIVGLIYMAEVDTELSWQWTKQGVPFGHSDHSTNDFTLVIELNVLSSNARYQRVTKKKKTKCYKDSTKKQLR